MGNSMAFEIVLIKSLLQKFKMYDMVSKNDIRLYIEWDTS